VRTRAAAQITVNVSDLRMISQNTCLAAPDRGPVNGIYWMP
jgi:hypothetical protein